MATKTFTITYPDGKAALILSALKNRYGQIDDAGVLRDRTNAEAFQALEADIKAQLRDIVKRYELTVFEAGIVDSGVT